MNVKIWIEAMRLRTLPLAVSSVGVGSFVAYSYGQFSFNIFAFLCITTILLQILSNLANDYGDSQNGADNLVRKGPGRAVQSGKITSGEMLTGVVIFALLSFISGIYLLYLSIGLFTREFYIFLILGFLCIIAAITYTMGKKPYGYSGLGDLSVLIFFGGVGVMGLFYLHTSHFGLGSILPALSLGFFSVAVLNINNIRDIESDSAAGKISIPVRIGKKPAVVYHILLLVCGMTAAIFNTVLFFDSMIQFLFLLSFPLFIYNGMKLKSAKNAESIDPLLKQLALSTFSFSILFSLGLVIAFNN